MLSTKMQSLFPKNLISAIIYKHLPKRCIFLPQNKVFPSNQIAMSISSKTHIKLAGGNILRLTMGAATRNKKNYYRNIIKKKLISECS